MPRADNDIFQEYRISKKSFENDEYRFWSFFFSIQDKGKYHNDFENKASNVNSRGLISWKFFLDPGKSYPNTYEEYHAALDKVEAIFLNELSQNEKTKENKPNEPIEPDEWNLNNTKECIEKARTVRNARALEYEYHKIKEQHLPQPSQISKAHQEVLERWEEIVTNMIRNRRILDPDSTANQQAESSDSQTTCCDNCKDNGDFYFD